MNYKQTRQRTRILRKKRLKRYHDHKFRLAQRDNPTITK